MTGALTDDVITPIDRYLAEQRDTTAVERFARHHDAELLAPDERWYSDRLPTVAPAPGEQYAFRVDLDQCTGCKSCVAACHSLNGLDEDESWRSVGQLVGADSGHPHQQTVPSGCHHCVEPACLSGCPTNAYEKDPISGIVRHLDDQCIGCSYCELTCPYEVPKLNKRLGIVRKCDMCADRLAGGEAPACVQACPTSAITITVVDTQELRTDAMHGPLVPGAPDSALTVPSTKYVGQRALTDDLVAADHHAVHLSRSHPPLAFMLVVTQMSVGAFLATLALDWFAPGVLTTGGAMVAAVAGLVALAASVLHLGRPATAWRAVLGIRHSWLSREIVAFGVYAVLATGYAVAEATDTGPAGVADVLGVAGALAGLIGVGCSALIYVVTRRTWWRARTTVSKFVATAAITGPLSLSIVVLTGSPGEATTSVVVALAAVSTIAATGKLLAEALVLRPARWPDGSDLARTVRLLLGPLAMRTRWRFVLGFAGGVAGPVAVVVTLLAAPEGASLVPVAVLAAVALGCALGGELLERHQFFVASVAPRMPGGFRR